MQQEAMGGLWNEYHLAFSVAYSFHFSHYMCEREIVLSSKPRNLKFLAWIKKAAP